MSAPNDEGSPFAAATPPDQTSADAAIVADACGRDKSDATLIAVAALAGFELRKLAAGRWLVLRWNLTRELADASAVRAFLAKAGVRA